MGDGGQVAAVVLSDESPGYLVGTDEAGSHGGQELDDGRAGVAPYGVVGPDLCHVGLPENMLSHHHTQVRHKEHALLSLGQKDNMIKPAP